MTYFSLANVVNVLLQIYDIGEESWYCIFTAGNLERLVKPLESGVCS